MKHILISLVIAALVIGCGSDKATPAAKPAEKLAQHEPTSQADDEKLIYYTCPMESHKHINSAEAGSCPECKMTLVPGVITASEKAEYYGCPMKIHSHIRHEAPGNCEECKMDLKPMRLDKSA